LELIRHAAELAEAAEERRAAGAGIGFVATMGALHEGHVSLLRRARAEGDLLVVSIFVNPLQFGPNDDLDRYPRDEARDLEICRSLGADLVWAPPVTEVFPPSVELPAPDPGSIGAILEGAARRGHFAGVLKVVFRLFEVVGACTSYFGEKDAQQLFLVRRMVEDLSLPVTIVACPTVRETDGLACSSRNAFLTAPERAAAGCLFLGLSEAAELSRSGERDAAVLVAAIAREVGATPLASLDYATVVDESSFEPVRTEERPARALVAARFGSTRLIDNLLLPTAG
jgi:pantoate--beta-alanine ligase